MESPGLNKRRRLQEGKVDPNPSSLTNDDDLLVAFPPISPFRNYAGMYDKALGEGNDSYMKDRAFDVNHIFSSSEDEYCAYDDLTVGSSNSTPGDLLLRIPRTNANLSPPKDSGLSPHSATGSTHSLNKRKRLSRLEKHISKSHLPPEYQQRFKRGFRITMQRDSSLLDYRVWNAMLDDLRVIGFFTVDENDADTSTSTCDAISFDAATDDSVDKGNYSSCKGTTRTLEDCNPLVFTNYCYDSNLYKLILKHLPVLFAMRLSILRLLAQRILEVKSQVTSTGSTDRLEYRVSKEIMEQAIRFFERCILSTDIEPREKHEDITHVKNGDKSGSDCMPSKQRKRVRLDLSTIGTDLLKIKTWQPTLSTAFIPSVLLSCRKLRAISSAKTQDGFSTTTCDNLAVNYSSSNALFNLTKRTLKSIGFFDIQKYKPLCEYQWENDAENYLDKNTISKARQTVLHMLSANIDVCGQFCIQQLWGTKASFLCIYEKLEKFIDEIQCAETKVGENEVAIEHTVSHASPPLIQKRCERMHALKSSAVLLDSIDVAENSNGGYGKYTENYERADMKNKNNVNDQNDHALDQVVVDRSPPQALSLALDCDSRCFLTSLPLYPYFLSLSLVMVSVGQVCVHGFYNSMFVCEIALIVHYIFYKLWIVKALQNAKTEDIPKLRQAKAIFDVTVSVLSMSAIVIVNTAIFPQPMNDEIISHAIPAFFCGVTTMCLYCTYHVLMTMKIGYQSISTLLVSTIVQMIVSPTFSVYGVHFSKESYIMWSAFVGAMLADIMVFIVRCTRRKHDTGVSEKCSKKYGFHGEEKGGKRSCMDTCGIFINFIIVMCTFYGMIRHHTNHVMQSQVFDVLKSKINMEMLINYGATAIAASLVMYANKNKFQF